ncbi:MAG: hypothetical protein J5967_04455, partial [Oscillospiraceae bacterium]|nr:hypothetical protein [Oscillospiraceae bacterium]
SGEWGGLIQTIVGTNTTVRYQTLGTWNYTAADDCLYLNNYQSQSKDLTTTGRGLRILAGGVNRLGKISVDGDLEIVGSGIFLVDELELTEGCGISLHANAALRDAPEGSVALFVKQADGSYLLVNGSMPGLLIDGLQVPEDVQLRMPADSRLTLQSVYRLDAGDEGYSYSCSAPGGSPEVVKAGLSATGLSMAQGAVLSMRGVCELILTGGGSRLTAVETNGEATLALGDDTRIEDLRSEGNVRLRIGEDEHIRDLWGVSGVVEISGCADITETVPTLTLEGNVDAALRLASGVLTLGKDCSFLGDIDYGYYVGPVTGMVDGRGLAVLDNRPGAVPRDNDYTPLCQSADMTPSLTESFLAAPGSYDGVSTSDGWRSVSLSLETWRAQPRVNVSKVAADYLAYEPMEGSGLLAELQEGKALALMGAAKAEDGGYTLDPFPVSYDLLAQQGLFDDCRPDWIHMAELLMKNEDGTLTTVYLRKSGDEIPNGWGLCGVRILDIFFCRDSQGGGTAVTSTSVSYTGTGVLGGRGAGSLRKGTALAPSYIHFRPAQSDDSPGAEPTDP